MTIEELEKQLKECQKALAELKESKKESKKENSCKWKPQVGEMYWYKNDMGDIKSSQYMCYVDEFRANNLLLFPTEKEWEKVILGLTSLLEEGLEIKAILERAKELSAHPEKFDAELNKQQRINYMKHWDKSFIEYHTKGKM